VTENTTYIIRGGLPGRERLRILSRVMRPTTFALLQRVGIRSGMACLDVGCGSGDVTFDMARIGGATGRAVGTDIDQAKITLARQQAEDEGLGNVEFRVADSARTEELAEFDLVHARFILSHLANPLQALIRMRQALRPNGRVVVGDVDFRGYFCYPDCPALWRHVALYTEAARRKARMRMSGHGFPPCWSKQGLRMSKLTWSSSPKPQGKSRSSQLSPWRILPRPW
jgi:ubiquinone/menaquinone biosynthesis C-methylase UbiE